MIVHDIRGHLIGNEINFMLGCAIVWRQLTIIILADLFPKRLCSDPLIIRINQVY